MGRRGDGLWRNGSQEERERRWEGQEGSSKGSSLPHLLISRVSLLTSLSRFAGPVGRHVIHSTRRNARRAASSCSDAPTTLGDGLVNQPLACSVAHARAAGAAVGQGLGDGGTLGQWEQRGKRHQAERHDQEDGGGQSGKEEDSREWFLSVPDRLVFLLNRFHRLLLQAQFVCPIPGCGSTFTRSFNLKGQSYPALLSNSDAAC